jgi:hypothetical protein
MAKYRISFLTGLAAGYVLGARAGRERYDQLVKAAKTVTEHPAVQQAAGTVQAQATGLATAAGAKIGDRVPQLAKTARDKVSEKVPGLHSRDGNGHGDVGDGSNLTTLSHPDGNGL